MSYQVDANESGLFIKTDSTILRPINQTSFKLSDSVRIEYLNDKMITIIDNSFETSNPYTETWHVTYIDTHIGLEIIKHQDLDTTEVNNLRYDRAPIDLIIWMLVIVTTCWMLIIDFKLLVWN